MPTYPQVTRLALKTILLPTDFSTESQAAVPFASALARVYGSTVLVAYSIPPEPHQQVVTDCLPAEDNRVWLEARQHATEFMRDRRLDSISCRALIDRGDIADVIPAMIRENAVDLVVLGTHGRRGVSKMIMGSGAEKIYRTATCPVLTIGPRVHKTEPWRLRSILCPLDIAEDPEPVLHFALSLAEEHQAELILLEAIPMVPWQHRASVEQRSRHALEGLIPEDAKNWCTPECAVRWEHPAEAILLESQARQVDLIVMGVHKSRVTSLSAHLPWPVASEVVSRALCPVLTVRI